MQVAFSLPVATLLAFAFYQLGSLERMGRGTEIRALLHLVFLLSEGRLRLGGVCVFISAEAMLCYSTIGLYPNR